MAQSLVKISASRRTRAIVTALEIGAVVLLAAGAVQLIYDVMTPVKSPDAGAYQTASSKGIVAAQNAAEYRAVISFDPFFRAVGAPVQSTVAAPESNLKITVSGTRTLGNGQGTAIVDTQDGGQKLARIGDEISPSVRLAAVYHNRIEISRAGVRETIYMVKPKGQQGVPGPSEVQASAGRAENTVANSAERALIEAFLTRVALEPVREGGRLSGFRIGGSQDATLLGAVGLEEGDILRSVAGEPLTSFERLSEIGEEIEPGAPVTIEFDRRGERLSVTVG